MDLKLIDSAGRESHYDRKLYGLRYSNSARGGALALQATIPIDLIKPSVTPGMEVRLYGEGSEAWMGRVEDVPRVTENGMAAMVSCIGPMAYLRDDAFQKTYIDNGVKNWVACSAVNRPAGIERDWSSNYRLDKANRLQVSPQNNQIFVTSEANGFIYQPPSGINITKITFDYEANSDTTFYIQVYAYASPTFSTILSNNTYGTRSGSVSYTPGANTTHILFQLISNPGSTYNSGEGSWYARITNVKVYGTTLTTNIYSSEVVKAELALASKISTDYSKITATTYDNPHMMFWDKVTPAAVIEEADKPHLSNYGFWDRGSDGKPRFTYAPHDLTTVHYYTTTRVARPDLAGESLQDRKNKVYVKYRDAEGTDVWEPRARTDATLDALGLTRSEALNYDTSSQAHAQQYGDNWLIDRARRQAKGQVIITGNVIDSFGRQIPPWRLKAGTNIMIRDLEAEPSDLTTMTSSNVLNGKNIFRITEVDVDYPKSATLQLDVPSDRLDLLLARGAFKG